MKLRTTAIAFGAVLLAWAGVYISCAKPKGNGGTSDGYGSELATSVVGGVVGTPDPTALVGRLGVFRRETFFDRVLRMGQVIQEADAMSYTCSTPSFTSCVSGSETYTPPSCSVSFDAGQTANIGWTGSWLFTIGGTSTLGPVCDCTLETVSNIPASLAAGCTFARTTPTAMTRSISTPAGVLTSTANNLVVTVDTTNPSGYNSSIVTNTSGAITTCGAGVDGCAGARTITIGGTHILATIDGLNLWDHTVSTDPSNPISVTGVGPTRTVVSGKVIVQHNKPQFTTTTTFNGPLTYQIGCCFPNGGSVTTTFSGGPDNGLTETLTFSSACGDATLTYPNGSTASHPMTQCL